MSAAFVLLLGCGGNSVEDQIRKTIEARSRLSTVEAGVAATLRARSSPTPDLIQAAVAATFTAQALSGTVQASVDQTRQAEAIATRNAMPTVPHSTELTRDQVSCEQTTTRTVAVSGDTWKAQTFVPAVSGRLVRVELPGTSLSGDPILHIRATQQDVVALHSSVVSLPTSE